MTTKSKKRPETTEDEASRKYCPFEFSKAERKEGGEIIKEWTCEALNCMKWRRKAAPPGREYGYCGLA